MAIQNFFTSRENSADASTFVGQEGRLWYNIDDNIIYASDGSTPGGIPVTSGSPSVYGDANVVVLLANNFGSNSIVTTGNIDVGNLVTSSIVSSAGNINIDGNLIPTANTYTIGSEASPWESAYFGPQSITVLDAGGNLANSVVIENTDATIVIQSAGFELETVVGDTIFKVEALTGQIFSNARTIIQNDINASNITSGSLQTAGGAGIAKDLYVGGNIILADSGNISNVDVLMFDTTSNIPPNVAGHLSWNTDDQTLDLAHPNGVIQQIGQELYGYVRNNTGNTIPNGTAVRFAGADVNGTARLEVAPFQANGEFPTLYGFGIATENIADGDDGRITVWGKVRDVDTSDFVIGDILYVSPTTAGDLTNLKPTAPNNVIPMAAVIKVGELDGEIFVRPSYEQQKNYGVFSSTIDQTLGNANTAGNITFNTTGSAQQISLDDVDSSKIVFGETGLYFTTYSAQLTSGNASAKDVRFWLAQDGNNIPDSARLVTVTGSGVFTPVNISYNVSITTANSYVQLRWATEDTNVSLDAVANTAYAPASPSVQVEIVQVAL